jgi:hypothetical protein
VLIIIGWICGKRGVYRFLVEKPEAKRHLVRRRCRYVDNIRLVLWGCWGFIVSWCGN